MDPLVQQALVAGIFTLAGLFLAYRQSRKAQKSGDANASYDQLQEDLKAMREERADDRASAIREREKDRREMQHLQGMVRHLDNEIIGLRNAITAGQVPPLPPRPDPPARPDWPVTS